MSYIYVQCIIYCTHAVHNPHMHDKLSAGANVPIVTTNHAECHGIISPLRNVLHQLESERELRGSNACLLSALLKVSQQ